MNKYIQYILLLLVLVATSCSVTKYVPTNHYLLDRVEIATDNKKIKSSSLEPYLKQKSNYRIFTFFRTQLSTYSLSGRDSTKWLNRFLRKLGEPPVIFDSELTERSRFDIEKSLSNQGYLNVTVDTMVVRHKKKATVIYTVNARHPYLIRRYDIEIGNDNVSTIVTKDSANSLLRAGEKFDRSLLDRERQRIVSLLRRNGYFAMAKERISYIADTSLNTNQVNLTMQLFANEDRAHDYTKEPEQRQYIVKNVYMVTEYDPVSSVAMNASGLDTLAYKGYQLIYGKNRWIRPEVLRSSCYIMPNEIFDEHSIDLTYNSFSRLKAVKYVNIRFEQASTQDSSFLNCYLMLSNAKTQSISTEVEGTNSSGDLGVASIVTYQHRNIFKGSETFSAKVRGAYERLTGVGVNSNFTELGTELGLSFPKFVFPFLDYKAKRKVRAISELIGSYNFQQRPEYTRVIAGMTWRYKWSNINATQRHSFDWIDASYVYLPWIDGAFFTNFPVDNPLLRYSYENHFIMRSGYTFYLTNQNSIASIRSPYSLRISVETAGNFLNAVSKLTNASKDANGYYQFLGISYSQYAKAEIDFAKAHVIDESNSLAWHANVGVACPYGNSQILPFEKRYFAGGANSVRGWSVRSLGPGIYKQTGTSSDFVNHSGDIKLDLSVELRSKLFWVLESAFFVDAGNIWTIRDYNIQEGGLFRFDQFYKEIALAYGLGVRFNFNFFVFRVDLGFKGYDPSQDGSLRWRFKHTTTSDMAWHMAIGYPF
ncbi:MAG: BamA/TamA family outer membrane protein [Bacteroidales bacterium]|nr:BamA/TamA family outer membrane protein [Bacteroidales bacterium]